MPWLCIKYLLSSCFARHTATVDHPFPNPFKYSFKISKELVTFENYEVISFKFVFLLLLIIRGLKLYALQLL